MASPSSETGRAYAVAREEQLDAASQCPVAVSRRIHRARRDATYCCRGRMWQIHLLWAGQIVCRLLEKLGKSDRVNVRRLTGVGGMAAVSRGRGWFHVKPMAKVPPGVLHKSLQTELSTEPVSSGCRMNVDGLSFPEVDPSCAVAREDELDATAMWILEVGRPSSTSCPMGWTACCRGRCTWYMRLLWRRRIECRALGKHSESDSRDVHGRTEGAGMVCTSWGLWAGFT